jgi:hypothetical protein
MSSRSNSASAAKMPKASLPCRGRGVDLGSLPRQHPEADVADGEVVHRVDQVPEIPAEAVELPDHERIAFPQRLQAGRQAGSIVAAAGGEVLVEVLRPDAGGEQGIPLQVQHLGPVRLRDMA